MLSYLYLIVLASLSKSSKGIINRWRSIRTIRGKVFSSSAIVEKVRKSFLGVAVAIREEVERFR